MGSNNHELCLLCGPLWLRLRKKINIDVKPSHPSFQNKTFSLSDYLNTTGEEGKNICGFFTLVEFSLSFSLRVSVLCLRTPDPAPHYS